MNEKDVSQVVMKMLSDQEAIKSVRSSEDYGEGEEYYFTYPEDKYFWSVAKDNSGDFFFFYYPSGDDKSVFLRFEADALGSDGGSNLKTLFSIIRSKRFGFDDVVKDILK
jgi:hypothetical protein